MSSGASYEVEPESTPQSPVANRVATHIIETNNETHPKPMWGNALSSPTTPIRLYMTDSGEELSVQLPQRTVIGRHSDGELVTVDLDLTTYGAVAKGVSRVHATLYRIKNVVFVLDMDSSNGTFLNGRRLVPYQERIVRDGDELRLGRLQFYIYF